MNDRDILDMTDREVRAALMMLLDKVPELTQATVTSVLSITRKEGM